MQQYNKAIERMINFDVGAGKNIKQLNKISSWILYRVLLIDGSAPEKSNVLFNLKQYQLIAN